METRARASVKCHQRSLLPLRENLLPIEVLQGESSEEAEPLLDDYFTFIKKARPTIAPLATTQEITSASRIIRHLNDAPVLAAAITAHPDWVLSNNTEHFTATVAGRTGLRIATPYQFFRAIHP